MASSPEDHSKEVTGAEANSEEVNPNEDDQSAESKSPADTTNELENPSAAVDSAPADGKINLFLKATSDVPIMRKKKWQVDETKTIHWVITFIKKYLKLDDKDTIYLYVAQAFAPSPDQQIKNLYECFGAEGKLVLHYSKTPAWG